MKELAVAHSNVGASVVASTQPLIYGVAGATWLGITFQDWVLVATGVLVVLNLTLAVFKMIELWRKDR